MTRSSGPVSTSTQVAEVAAALAALAPRGVLTGVAAIDERDVEAMFPEEAAAVAGAVPSRRREFASGRVLLRSLIGQSVPIGVAPDRAPRWPVGMTGSVAHDAAAVAAAAAPVSVTAGLGVDLEAVGPMSAEEAAVVLHDGDDPVDPRLGFVLKEAAYKAWSATGGRFLEFHEVSLRVEPGTVLAEVVGGEMTLSGRWAEAGGRWVALVVAPPADEAPSPSGR